MHISLNWHRYSKKGVKRSMSPDTFIERIPRRGNAWTSDAGAQIWFKTGPRPAVKVTNMVLERSEDRKSLPTMKTHAGGSGYWKFHVIDTGSIKPTCSKEWTEGRAERVFCAALNDILTDWLYAVKWANISHTRYPRGTAVLSGSIIEVDLLFVI